MKRTFFLFIFLSAPGASSSFAQCVATGFLTPNITGNDNSVGLRDWNNTNLVNNSDDNYAGVIALIIGDDTHYHLSGGYGFSIPSTATICGIEVRVERGEGGLLANVRDNSVRIVKGGTITGSEHALAGGWSAADAVGNYGSSTDTWGQSWTPADINANTFGLAFSANLGGVAVLPNARIDQIRIRVWYNNILPIELLHFETSCSGEKIVLQWETASEVQNDHFDVQHSLDGTSFTTIQSIAGNGTTSIPQQYRFEDLQPGPEPIHYYRLIQYDVQGDSLVYAIHATECWQTHPSVQVYLSVQDMIQVTLTGFQSPVQISVIDLSGNVLRTYAVETSGEEKVLLLENTAALKAGCYLVTATSAGKTYPCKVVLTR